MCCSAQPEGGVTVPRGGGGRRPQVLLAASGSVAAIKLPELARLLAEFADVRLLLTAAARKFVSEADFPPEVLPLYGAFSFAVCITWVY